MTLLRAPRSSDEPALLALNNAHAEETSLLEPGAFSDLLTNAYRVRMAPECEGFCIALDQDAPYRNPNFAWFASRHERFVYVDRIIVAASARGRGLARCFYEDLMDAMRANGQNILCCEVNLEPPNPGSDRFHAAMGFVEAGRANLTDRGKTVRYMERSV